MNRKHFCIFALLIRCGRWNRGTSFHHSEWIRPTLCSRALPPGKIYKSDL